MPIKYDELMALKNLGQKYAYSDREVMLYACGIGMGADPMDEKELAFSWLERGLAAGAIGAFYKDEPVWDPIRSDPRFADLLRRWPHVFEVNTAFVTLRAKPDTVAGRTAVDLRERAGRRACPPGDRL